MIKKLSSKFEKTGTSRFVTSVVVVGTALLVLLKPGASTANNEVKDEIFKLLNKYPDKEYIIQEDQTNTQTHTFNQASNTMNGGNDALSYASTNVSKYYPDMKDHVNMLLNNFRNDDQRNAVDSLLNKHIMKNITDPKQRTAAIIYAIEKYAYLGSTTITRKFSQTHVKDIDKTNAQFIIKGFGYGYIDRFNSYYTKLEQILQKIDKEINEIDKEIKEINKEIEGIIGQFTINDVLTKPDVKRLVLKTEAFYIRQKKTIPSHLAELIKVAKQ